MLTTIRTVSPAQVIVAGVWAPLPKQMQARADYTHIASAVVARHHACGEPVAFLETSTLLGPGDLFDGLPTNANGYRKIAVLWEAQIRSHVGGRA